MVAPSAFPKESASPTDSACPGTPNLKKTGKPEKAGESESEKNNPSPEIAPVKKFLVQGIIMNPTVLSIISFPNKCIMKKSEKYVINGLSVPSATPENKNGSKQQTKLPNKNVKTKPSAKLKRYAGLLLAILSSMMFSFTGLIVKILNHHHPLTQATWMFIATTIVAIPLNLVRYIYISKVNKKCEKSKHLERKSSETFKFYPDNIETVKVLDGEKGKTGETLPPSQAVVEITNNNSTKAELMRKEKRLRQIKLFLLLVVRACSGCSGMILFFYSLKYLNIGDSLVIVCSSPIFVFIIGYLFLGETCGVIPVLTIILSMIGVAVITRPPMLTGNETFEADDMIGAGLAFSSMLCIATTIILMRFLQNVYHGLINLVFGIWGSIQTTALAIAVGVLECPHDLQDATLMAATGILFFLGQTFLAVALQFEQAGPVSLVRTSEVVFAFVWQFIFLSVSPDWFSISGAGLILAGIFLTITRKWIASMPESSKSRKMFGFLLR